MQNEIDQELRLSEFRKEMQEELNRIEALERKVQQQLEEIQKQQTSEHLEVTEKQKKHKSLFGNVFLYQNNTKSRMLQKLRL